MIKVLTAACTLTLVAATSSTAQISATSLLDDYVNAEPAYISYDRMPEFDLHGSSEGGATAGRSWTAYALNMTSQAWLTEEDWGADWGGAGAQWWHWCYVIVPSEVFPGNEDWRTIYVTQGKNTDTNEGTNASVGEDVGATGWLAMSTGQVVVTLFQVPCYPIYFRDDPSQHRNGDDDLLAKTFVHFMDDVQSGEPASLEQASWVVILPMVKAAFAGMAAADDFLAADLQLSSPAQSNWVVMGASKRGWTAWLVGAVDAARTDVLRPQVVRGIAPLVLDGLNFKQFLHLHYGSYGGWSFAMRAFVEAGFTGRIDTPEFDELFGIIDPVAYSERYAGMPKLVGDAAGDEWFMPDDARNWIDDMPAPLALFISPDSPHSLSPALPALLPTMAGFIHRIASGFNATAAAAATAAASHSSLSAASAAPAAPAIKWAVDYGAGAITMTIDCADTTDCYLARTVRHWSADSCSAQARRDFRLMNRDIVTFANQTEDPCRLCGAVATSDLCFNLKSGLWRNKTLSPDTELDPTGNTYVASQPVPALDPDNQLWSAFFVAVTFHDAASGMRGSYSKAELKESGGGSDSCEEHIIAGRRYCLPVVALGDMTVTSQLAILPDYLPFSCSGEQCQGGDIADLL